MKNAIIKSFLFTVCCSFFVFNLNAQNTVEENKIWSEIYNWFNMEVYTTGYKFSGDTTINNVPYKKLWFTGDSLSANNWHEKNEFFREDSQHKIYRYNENGDELLYDFSLEVGDTFEIGYLINQDPCSWEIDQIDSLELNNGEFRKRFTLKRSDQSFPIPPVDYIYWVQGIGCLSSLTQFSGTCNFDFSLKLICFMENGDYLYTSPNYNGCFISPISEIELQNFKIYPNPTTDILTIEKATTFLEDLDWTLFNALGQEIKSAKIPAFEATRTISLADLSKGIYFYSLSSDERLIKSGKLVVER